MAKSSISLQWRHNERDCVSNHQPNHCLLKRLFGQRSNKTSKFRVTGLREGNSPGTGDFPAQRASYAENISIWWHHHAVLFNIVAKSGDVFCTYNFLIYFCDHNCQLEQEWVITFLRKLWRAMNNYKDVLICSVSVMIYFWCMHVIYFPIFFRVASLALWHH